MMIPQFRLWASVCLALALSLAAKARDEAPFVTISDAQVWQMLSSDERLQWQFAKDQIDAAKAQIENGKWLLQRELSVFDNPEVAKRRLEDTHARGRREIELGEEKRASSEAILASLRAVAADRLAADNRPTGPREESIEVAWVTAGSWALLADSVDEALQQRGVNRLYFAGLFQDSGAGTIRVDPVALQSALRETDRGRFRLQPIAPEEISVTSANGPLRFQFPEVDSSREYYQSAVVIGREVPLSADLGLRVLEAIDLRTLAIIQRSMALVPLGEDADGATPGFQLKATLNDQRRFVDRVLRASEPFRFRAMIQPSDSPWRVAGQALFEVAIAETSVAVLPVSMFKRLYELDAPTSVANAEFRLRDELMPTGTDTAVVESAALAQAVSAESEPEAETASEPRPLLSRTSVYLVEAQGRDGLAPSGAVAAVGSFRVELAVVVPEAEAAEE